MKRQHWLRSALGVLILGLVVGTIFLGSELVAHANPVQFGDHWYEYVTVVPTKDWTENTWQLASDAAASSVYNGMSGHLATISSQQENDFVLSLISGSYTGFVGGWLGGKSPQGWLVGPEAGQQFAYTNWNDSSVGGMEPNNNGRAYMMIGTAGFYNGSYMVPGRWMDSSTPQGIPDAAADPVKGYFVEYEQLAPVPEPSTVLLLGTGLVVFVVARNKPLSRKVRDAVRGRKGVREGVRG